MPQIIIKKGENLSTLAQQYGTDVATLQKMNGLANPNLIKEGAVLQIPDSGAAPSIDKSARSLPADKTLEGAGSIPGKTLPETPKNPLLQFSSVMNDAITLAKQKRAAATKDLYGTVAPEGALPATSFANFLSADLGNSNDFTKPLVDTAMDAFKTSSEQLQKNKETIQAIAQKVAEVGGSASVVKSILGTTDVEHALILATGHLKAPKATGTGDGTDKDYSPEDIRTLKAAGLYNNPDKNVKNFFLASPSEFRNEWTKNYAKGANQSANIVNIGQSLDEWQKMVDDAKKSNTKKVTNPFAN